MRVIFTSDFHGRMALYAQLTNLLRAEKPELLILGGDMNAECDRANPQGSQVAFVQKRLASMIDAWKAMVPGLSVACIAGNHDVTPTVDALGALERAGRVHLLDHRHAPEIGGLLWLGLAPSPPSPFWVKDLERLDFPGDNIPDFDGAVWDPAAGKMQDVTAAEHFQAQPTLVDLLREVPALDGPWVFVCHAPPHGTRLDRLPNVEAPIGSRAVRDFVETQRPLCTLHGHVHESPQVTGEYIDRVGQTYAVNPGQDHDRLHAVVFDTADVVRTIRHTVMG
ncbi:MAG: metallophosphoesterase [Phycisphaerae bacterium]|jgi:Icc-related predicted phosphoesterase